MLRTTASADRPQPPAADVTIRRAGDADAAALVRLATLDCRPPLAGPCLLAEVDGALAAALSLASGAVAADPFRPTADVVALLQARARHLRAAEEPRARRGLSLGLPRAGRGRLGAR